MIADKQHSFRRGAMPSQGLPQGLFLTTSVFTAAARRFAEGKEPQLMDGAELIQFILHLPDDRQARLFDVAFSDSFDVPTCPNCDVKMVRRVAGRGANAGQEFWGGPRDPRCRQTFQVVQVERTHVPTGSNHASQLAVEAVSFAAARSSIKRASSITRSHFMT